MRRKFETIPHHVKKNTLCAFNKIQRHHATYCMIRMIKDTNKKEMIKDFFLLEFNKCNALLFIIKGKKLL